MNEEMVKVVEWLNINRLSLLFSVPGKEPTVQRKFSMAMK